MLSLNILRFTSFNWYENNDLLRQEEETSAYPHLLPQYVAIDHEIVCNLFVGELGTKAEKGQKAKKRMKRDKYGLGNTFVEFINTRA